MAKADIGLIGLAVMGQNLVLNMESKGYCVAVYNRTAERTREFIDGPAKGKERIIPAYTLEEFVASLSRPRKVMIMVKAGKPVDDVINSLVPLLDEGDIVIDGGNSYFKDTIRRTEQLAQKGILFMGVGVSGGEEGALKGPSIMPGGSYEAWKQVGKILRDIAAKVGDGIPCCDYVGPDGAGHYVKMVHNGIEYGDMQLISEAYFLMKELLGLSAPEMQSIFQKWNEGELNSYLIEITADILGRIDEETGLPMVDVILDRAGQKGTGKWTSQDALDLGVAIPTITEAVFARCISAIKEERVAASKVLKGPQAKFDGDREQLIEDIGRALYASKICSYAQGFALLKQASETYNWNLKLGDIALLWRGGCIIRAQFLERIKEAYTRNPSLANLLLDPYFKEVVEKAQDSWRRVVSLAVQYGIPVPCFSSALFYYDSYRREKLPANLIQAQRDYFGAHTYERVDREGTFHTDWLSKK
ncbi:MAG: NADP-dependent phosphogluconate dehydrogenase [Caldicoprobacter oshimai]|uniref:6-phosphogluconate dehydrogenase, decarboxylating n=1 Tax=Caldicoprobacter faecalis TaxID=937334 RepID=A0A1I5Y3R3_9FIRM|nr:NADP-dependent phosphogluconate dehydrogenase [Caldicoprobacter faecalis]PZN09371.1 MAG: NADP-dependent phosphogluconate dehydrogenase [Caldicoprobacter oshimai]SFQ38587.1 6-phosphogluconate dehydrogenase (decarboxylating) [Caldicoprobacter faecalis]